MTDHLVPTFVGFVASLVDAAIVIEGSMQGFLPRVAHRPPECWHADLARSGHIFVFEEKESDIKRWTDGVKWSPSRLHEGFMLYRELDRHAAQNRRHVLPVNTRARDQIAGHGLYGSLIDSYHFRNEGLMKKTISVRQGESCWRLISYYQVENVTSRQLTCPSQDPRLWNVQRDKDLRRAMGCWGLLPNIELVLNYQQAALYDGMLTHISGRYNGIGTDQDFVQYEECFDPMHVRYTYAGADAATNHYQHGMGWR